MRKVVINAIASISVGGVLLYYSLEAFEFRKVSQVVAEANASFLVGAFLLIVLAYGLRGYRWNIWQRDLGYWESCRLILIGFMGNNVLPARLGEILRAHCTAHKTGENYGRTAALASIAIERVLDGFVLSIGGLMGLLFLPASQVLFVPLLLVCLFFVALTGGLISGIHFHEAIRNYLSRMAEIFPGHLTRFGQEKVNYFLDGLLLLYGWGALSKALALSALVWGVELAAYSLIANGIGSGVSWSTCMLFLVVVNFASLFPFTIGGIGSIEGAATMFLVGAGIPAGFSLAMVITQHLYQFLFTTLVGGAIYYLGGYYKIPMVREAKPTGKANMRALMPGNNILEATRNELKGMSVRLGLESRSTSPIPLSIVIPAYNEQKRLPKTVLQTIAWCRTAFHGNYEILIVDDGSADETANIAGLFASQVEGVRFIACPHMGKGAAVRVGMLNAVGERVLFMDADGATPLSEIPKMIRKIDEGCDVVIGSRVVQVPGETEVVTTWYRRLMGRVFAGIVNVCAAPGFADTQCGFKMFRQAIVREVFMRQVLNGFAFDVEVLYLAKKLSLRVSEVPVNWINQEGSKVNLVTDSIKMFMDIMRIKWLHKAGQWGVRQDRAPG